MAAFAERDRAGATEHLREHLALVTLRLERHVARFGHRILSQDGRVSDLSVSLEEVRRLTSGTASLSPESLPHLAGWRRSAILEAELEAGEADLERRWRRAPQRPELPLERVREAFALTPLDIRLLVLAAAPHLSIDLARFYRYALADNTQRLPTVGFLIELAADSPRQEGELLRALDGGSRLVAERLLTLGEAHGMGDESLRHRPVIAPDWLVAFLESRTPARTALVASATKRFAPDEALDPETIAVVADTRRDLERLVAQAFERGLPLRLLLVGASGSGRRTLIGATLARHGRGYIEVDVTRLAEAGDAFESALASLCQEAHLRRQVIVLRSDHLPSSGALSERLRPALERVLGSIRGDLVITSVEEGGFPWHAFVRKLHEMTLVPTTSTAETEVWRRSLAATGLAFEESLPTRLATHFHRPPGVIVSAVADARHEAEARAEGALTFRVLADAVKRRGLTTLSGIAEPFRTELSWDDAVLATETRTALDEITGHAKMRGVVMDDWDFRRKLSYGRGVSCLFYGPPGTGKTMVASLVAQRLERELYRVDLSRITSKWIGETEKNLAELFREAEKAQVILLFDEADSIFTKRVQVTTATDRSANSQINYLLQRMESFDGMSILTTNAEQAIDEAFKRRIRYKVFFPKPDVEQREALWRSVLPDKAPVEPEIDSWLLAERFEMSGAHIKNAVYRAALRCAEDGVPLSTDALFAGARAEAIQIGLVVRA